LIGIRWITPSSAEPDESVIYQSLVETTEIVENKPEIRGSAARGQILHKIMEEVLHGLTAETRVAFAARAAELIKQLGFVEAASASQGLHRDEIADSVGRTLSSKLLQHFRGSLLPEFPVFELREVDGHLDAYAGVIDAVGMDSSGKPEYVFDWKSTVSPSLHDMQKHAAQLRIYLDQLKIENGALIYMTGGDVIEVTRAAYN